MSFNLYRTGFLFHAYLKCWEAMLVRDHDGPKEALDVLQEAAHSLEKVQDKTATNFKLTQGLYSYTEGEIYYKTQDFKKALQSLNECLRLTEKLPEVNIQLARCYNAIGNCYYNGLEDYTKALEFYYKALKKIEEISGSSEYHYELPVSKNQIGTVYEGQGNYAEAIEYYKEAIRLSEKLKISGSLEEAHFQRNLANAYMQQDKFKEAVEPAERAFEIRKKHLGDHPDTVRSIFQRGVIQAFLKGPKKALELFKKAWEMEKLLQPGNHSVVWKLIIEHIVRFIRDGYHKKKFKKEALAFCQRMWKEEKEISTFSFNKSTKEIIDTLMRFLREGKRDESAIYEYEKEELWFYDGFQSSTEQDFCREFDAETDNSKLNVMICDRIKLIDKILDLCDRLDQHEMRTKYQRIKLTIYRKVLFRPNFVGKGGNEKETIKKAAEQLYRDLGEKERIAELSMISTLESEVKKEEEEKEGQSVSDEEEIVIGFEDETVEQLEEEEGEVVSTSDRESEMASEDENEFLGDFSDTNCESIVLYR